VNKGGKTKEVDKRKVRRSIRQLQVIKTWQLVILLILMLFITATFLRLNNTGMVSRRNAIAAADKSGDVDQITQRLYDMQRYSSAHMNASSGVMYLQDQYNRDVQRQAENASQTGSVKALEIRRAAEEVCRPQFNGWSPAYVQCYVNELNKHPSDEVTEQITPPSSALYRYDFVSPLWSPDFAGWSALVSLLITVVIVLRIIGLIILRVLLRHHYKVA
jgi:hypothetical protein